MTTKQPRAISYFTDYCGNLIARVPLANSAESALILAEDLNDLLAAGYTDQWTLNSNGQGQAYVRCGMSGVRGNLATVARLVMKPVTGYRVTYADGNRLNLCWNNLELVRGARPKKLPPIPAKGKERRAKK